MNDASKTIAAEHKAANAALRAATKLNRELKAITPKKGVQPTPAQEAAMAEIKRKIDDYIEVVEIAANSPVGRLRSVRNSPLRSPGNSPA